MPLTLALAAERWPIAGSFAISRGAKTEAVVVVAELGDGKARGRGECVPYARYGESVASVMTQINAMRPQLATGLDRRALQSAMPPGAARNALDCAFWDYDAKRSGRPVHELAGLAAPHALTTAYTISLGPPAAMAAAAAKAVAKPASRALLKIKLGGSDEHGGDARGIAAMHVRAAELDLEQRAAGGLSHGFGGGRGHGGGGPERDRIGGGERVRGGKPGKLMHRAAAALGVVIPERAVERIAGGARWHRALQGAAIQPGGELRPHGIDLRHDACDAFAVASIGHAFAAAACLAVA